MATDPARAEVGVEPAAVQPGLRDIVRTPDVVVPPVEVRAVEVDMAMPDMPVPKVSVTEMSVTEMSMAAATETTAEAAAAMADFDGQIVRQIFCLRSRRRVDQRYSLRALDRCRKQHQPCHGEEAKHSLHP
jgi:hypothetical protein